MASPKICWVSSLELFDAAMAHLSDRFLVEQMAADVVAEFIVGVTRDPQFGLALTLGAGGVLVELLKDSVSLLLPTTDSAIRAALLNLRSASLLQGFRGRPAADLDALALQSRGNVEQLGSMHHALHEHSQANQSLSEQLQQISDALLRQSGDNQQLHELTLYLTQMTAILEARP